MGWIIKHSNLRESPKDRDTLLITDAVYRVKRRFLKLLLECYMQKLHNEIIASLDDLVLLVVKHADTNCMMISDTILCSLAPPQPCTMTYHHKMICSCDIFNTSKYFQESINAWRRKKLEIMKDK